MNNQAPDNIMIAMRTIVRQEEELAELRAKVDEYKARVHDLNERLLEANQDIKDLTWRLERLRP
jgi:predicted RNase H-like nuclease (RuvC/YqgF family)